jgi:hypothetical protein
MSTEQKDLEQNALASRLSRMWTNLRQGKLIGYKWMAVILLLVTALGLWWYISHERKKSTSSRWVALDEASTPAALEEITTNYPGTIQDRLARLELARNQLGEAGIDQLMSIQPEQQKKAVDNIEKARTAFGTLLDEFNDDPVFKAECLLGLAKAEAALVAVPTKSDQLTEFKGSVEKVIEYLDRLSAAAAPDTPWATDSKNLADRLRGKDRDEFVRLMRDVFELPGATLPKGPTNPLGPFAPPVAPGGTPPGVTLPVIPGLGGK